MRNCKLTLKLETESGETVGLSVTLPADSPEVEAVVHAAIRQARPENRQLDLFTSAKSPKPAEPAADMPERAPGTPFGRLALPRIPEIDDPESGPARVYCKEPNCSAYASKYGRCSFHQPKPTPRARKPKPQPTETTEPTEGSETP